MSWLFHGFLFWVIPRCRTKGIDRERELLLEVVALRHQISVLRRKVPKPRLSPRDRWLCAWSSNQWKGWKRACVLVKPETVIRWHRQGLRLFWRWKSRPKGGGRPKVNPGTVALIRRISVENPRWGAPRIHGELVKLGVAISERSVLQYMPKRPHDPDRQTWKTFLDNHRETIAAMDFFTVPTWNFRWVYGLVILGHDRREILHVATTRHPTAEWLKAQLREAFPGDAPLPKRLLFDRDSIFGAVKEFITALGITPHLIAYRSPWQNGAVERVIGTLKRELLDHVIVLNEDHLRRLLKDFVKHYHDDRTHLGLGKDTPKHRPDEARPSPRAEVVSLPRLGGLSHRYTWTDAA